MVPAFIALLLEQGSQGLFFPWEAVEMSVASLQIQTIADFTDNA